MPVTELPRNENAIEPVANVAPVKPARTWVVPAELFEALPDESTSAVVSTPRIATAFVRAVCELLNRFVAV